MVVIIRNQSDVGIVLGGWSFWRSFSFGLKIFVGILALLKIEFEYVFDVLRVGTLVCLARDLLDGGFHSVDLG